MSNGKGSNPRPFSVSMNTYKNNFDRIFSSKTDTCEYSGLPATHSYANSEDIHRQEYKKMLDSGMFFETFPGLTGNWEDDKERWKTLKR
jgi:hypothetical protein